MRQVPQDLTAEQSLLGAMLVDPNCIPEVIEQVRADDFYADENKRIFETIYSMFNGAQKIDPVTVLDMLTRLGYYDEAGGRAYLFQLMEVTPGTRNVSEYVRIVRDKSLLRQLADAGAEIQQHAPVSYTHLKRADHLVVHRAVQLFPVAGDKGDGIPLVKQFDDIGNV